MCASRRRRALPRHAPRTAFGARPCAVTRGGKNAGRATLTGCSAGRRPVARTARASAGRHVRQAAVRPAQPRHRARTLFRRGRGAWRKRGPRRARASLAPAAAGGPVARTACVSLMPLTRPQTADLPVKPWRLHPKPLVFGKKPLFASVAATAPGPAAGRRAQRQSRGSVHRPCSGAMPPPRPAVRQQPAAFPISIPKLSIPGCRWRRCRARTPLPCRPVSPGFLWRPRNELRHDSLRRRPV
jgi:hypothetical protein